MSRQKRAVSFMLILVMVLSAVSLCVTAPAQTEAATKNLLVNGNAEKGSLKGWNATTENWKATDGEGYGAPCAPYKGKYFFWAVNEYESKTSLYQTVSVKSSYIGKTAVLSGYMCVWNQTPSDRASLTLTFYNKRGKAITAKTVTQKKAKWKKFTVKVKVPKGAKKMRVTLKGVRKNGMLDAYYDNLSLVVK